MPRGRASLVIGLAALVLADVAAAGDPIPVSRAAEHVGEEITIEGRVVATHDSPLATVLAFTPNFAGFTASVLAADRPKFPVDLDERCRDKVVRMTGTVTSYRGKPEMTIREPAQLLVVPRPGATPVPPDAVAPAPTPVVTPGREAEATRSLALIEQRLGALEARLAAIERALAAQPRAAEPGSEVTLRVGAPARAVRKLLGEPAEIVRAPDGGSAWLYGSGRSVSFDRLGRVASWEGF